MDEKHVRPGVLQWLRYAYVGSIAPRHHSWVLHDVTCRTWVVRHVARYLAIIGPFAIALLIALPAPLPLRMMACLTALMSMMVFYLAYINESVDRRAEKAGYPSGLAAHLRQQRAVAAQRATVAKYRARRARRS